jgi:uncharacterized protein YdiU (UPF0061 family)
VFSSIDQWGRYSWKNQPDIALWNLAQLASALLPLMGGEGDRAVEEATEALDGFRDLYFAAWAEVLRAKTGQGDAALGTELLDVMAEGDADFTNTFRALTVDPEAARGLFAAPERFDAWRRRWEAASPDCAAMRRVNPAVIPRNHRVEAAIRAAYEGDLAPFHRMHEILSDPWEETEANAPYRAPAAPEERVTRTFCGT